MKHDYTRSWRLFFALVLAALLAACGETPAQKPETTDQPPAGKAPSPAATAMPTVPTMEVATATPTPTPTPTPTAEPLLGPATEPAPAASRCQGLAGTLEVQVLVGPAEAVGLEPVSVGHVAFTVTGDQSPYSVEGQAPISYEAVLEEKWGTYTVSMDLELAVDGECNGEAGSEHLDLVLEMTGEQLVVVEAEGFQGEYPWSGSHSLNLLFPLQEGASAKGEGWVAVLHLASPH
jgi:hypothetical protein